MPEDTSLVYPLDSNQAAILLWVIERPHHGRVDLHRGGLAESTFEERVSPLETLGLLTFPSDVLIETRAGRAISGIIEITDSGIASFKAFIEKMPAPPISPEEVDALVTNRGRREHPPIMEW